MNKVSRKKPKKPYNPIEKERTYELMAQANELAKHRGNRKVRRDIQFKRGPFKYLRMQKPIKQLDNSVNE